MDRHTRHLGWGCPFQQCRLSTSIPRDNWQSDQHIDKAHDEMYEPLRPLALPRPAGLPTPPYSSDFRTLQPAWTLLLACPKASTRQHSKPLPSQIHQPPAAAAGMIGTVPPVFEPGCHPWNVMHPILDDLEPHAVPLFDVEPLGQEAWVELEELTSEERSAPEVSDPSKSSVVADGVADNLFNTLDDPIDVDEELSSGFITPPLPPERMEEIDTAMIQAALSKVVVDRKEALVQTDDLIEDMRFAAASANAEGENHLAGPSSSARSPSFGYSGTVATSSLVPSELPEPHSDGEPSESREAGVQAGQCMIVMSKATAVEYPTAESGVVPTDIKSLATDSAQLPTFPTSPSASAPVDSSVPPPKGLSSTEMEVQTSSEPSLLGLTSAATEVRSATPPPPYTY